MVIDFFEWKFNHRVVFIKEPCGRLREYLEMELARVLQQDNERVSKDPDF